jgi:hypothetical protein
VTVAPAWQTRRAPAEHPAGWSDRLEREMYAQVERSPNQWQETPASAALCIHCPEPLADDDLLRCTAHVSEHGIATPRASGRVV